MLMAQVGIGEMVFNEIKLDDEIRETYYTRTSVDTYTHHGCIQNSPVVEDQEVPRYINFSSDGYRYALVGALPVKPIIESRFFHFRCDKRNRANR
jgi:hypothetical protein